MDKQQIAHAILQQALPEVPFDGWTDAVIDRAAVKCGLRPGEYVRIFPAGVIDALNAWAAQADANLRAQAATLDLSALKIRERIAALVKRRIEHHTANREALRSAMSFYLVPWHAVHGMRCLTRTVDLIWELAGDRSLDFNWYSKRMLLAGVYSSTLLYWLDDTSEQQQNSWSFLDRRIANVLQLGKMMPFGKAKKA